jgi:hypothetical protein
MWVIDPLFIRPSLHPKALARPSTPIVLRAKERILIPYPSTVLTFRLLVESTKEFGGASISIWDTDDNETMWIGIVEIC